MKLFYTTLQTDSRSFVTSVLQTHCAVPAPQYRRNRNGKPYLVNAPLYFSLSHSGGVTAVAVGEREMGLDLQLRDDRKREALLRRLTPAEREEDFFRLWTAKEAYVKFTGGTLAGMLPSLVFEQDTLFEHGEPVAAWLYRSELLGCALAVCAAEEEKLELFGL